MQVIPQSARDRIVREAADRYIREGYPVQIMPLDADLPEFLKGFRPDLIITTPEGHIVVNVKTKGFGRTAEDLGNLKKALRRIRDGAISTTSTIAAKRSW